jgi:shikimate kinase
MNKTIVLTGLMGAGKTYIGKKISKAFGLKFFDSDNLIKEETGYSPKEIFDYFGLDFLKEMEFNAIKRILDNKEICVISTGDITITNKKAWDYLKENCLTIWLDISISSILKRVRQTENRPFFDKKDTLNLLKRLYEERKMFYQEANIIIKGFGFDYKVLLNILTLCGFKSKNI